jgi:hypothetical protein
MRGGDQPFLDGPALMLLLFVLAGGGGAYELAAARAFVQAMPDGQRGRRLALRKR